MYFVKDLRLSFDTGFVKWPRSIPIRVFVKEPGSDPAVSSIQTPAPAFALYPPNTGFSIPGCGQLFKEN
jgi:hypothetical protein